MIYLWGTVLLMAVGIVVLVIRHYRTVDARAQKALNEYLRQDLSATEIGRFYERFIGHLYETEGYDVLYNGAIQGYADLGRDIIARSVDEDLIIQAKCWSQGSVIHVSHVYQLYGTTKHYDVTVGQGKATTRAIFYTTAKFSDAAKSAAEDLGVELRFKKLDRNYPMIKCCISNEGDKVYYLPFDTNYDRVKVDLHREEYFVKTVKEAVKKGFKRAA